MKDPVVKIVCLATLLVATCASAQQPYPSRLVRIISPQATGSTIDAILRAVGTAFSERTGLPPSALQAGLAAAEARGLIERDGARVRPSPRGFDFLNDLQALFLPAARP